MGTSDSGNRQRRPDRKLIVEDAITLEVWLFRIPYAYGASGTIKWTFRQDEKWTADYFISTEAGKPTIYLKYTVPEGQSMQTSIQLQTTPVHFGGARNWFTCPLRRNGVPCERRCGKLYLYPGLRYFGCRHCLDLTYRSSREAHQFGRACASMGFGREETRLLEERFSRKHRYS